MKLIVPSLKYKDSFLDALMEFEKTKEAGFWKFPDETPRTLESYIERILNHSEGADLPDNWVPCTSYWLIDENNEFVGHINIRHRLNDFLTNFGGHIGYAIRPSMRRQGHGTQILKLALPKAAALGLDRILITCDKTNTPSLKIIEKNNGIFENECEQTGDLPTKLRFWIDLV
ncbi:GNAT family N-acetyltransferase [Candidatus Peregrinibacteria bacterium]|jgi:predicted acetyltransferase|nr:GNAT family N-acetyltransferase [Candidatus Peregrinibacteria bacterium]MBT7483296.1 GNAT family N-acetyltransferase [Candidatus Peregrinibacteria bacterium]MBT7702621.1 GNAT family N-acetyltransferase [Candidatus Peregrinibacteria bacterium]